MTLALQILGAYVLIVGTLAILTNIILEFFT